jgi:hypothetical protein
LLSFKDTPDFASEWLFLAFVFSALMKLVLVLDTAAFNSLNRLSAASYLRFAAISFGVMERSLGDDAPFPKFT